MKIADDLVRAAIHEAGHVVAALEHGFDVELAHIRPVEACNGLAIIRPAPVTAGAEGAVVLTAGEEAVRLAEAKDFRVPSRVAGAEWYRRHLARERNRRRSWRKPSAEDEATRAAVLATFEDEEVRAARAAGGSAEALAVARTRAGIALRSRWRTVYGIADYLLAHGEIDGGTARAIWRRFEPDAPAVSRSEARAKEKQPAPSRPAAKSAQPRAAARRAAGKVVVVHGSQPPAPVPGAHLPAWWRLPFALHLRGRVLS